VTLGQRLKRFRTTNGMTQKELAARAGVRQALISELETGRKRDTLSRTLQRLADACGISLERLLGEDGCRPDPYTALHLRALALHRGRGTIHRSSGNVSAECTEVSSACAQKSVHALRVTAHQSVHCGGLALLPRCRIPRTYALLCVAVQLARRLQGALAWR
jgi:transcriptional regulator with XRE-family HTH domain